MLSEIARLLSLEKLYELRQEITEEIIKRKLEGEYKNVIK